MRYPNRPNTYNGSSNTLLTFKEHLQSFRIFNLLQNDIRRLLRFHYNCDVEEDGKCCENSSKCSICDYNGYLVCHRPSARDDDGTTESICAI